MNRTEARALWQRVAAGELESQPDEFDRIFLRGWMREVAAKLLEADDEPVAGKRPGRIVEAVGLTGKADGYAALRALVDDAIFDFPVLVDGAWTEQAQADIVRELVERARALGLLRGEYATDDKVARDLMRDLWQKKL